jgi:hypothetical protein
MRASSPQVHRLLLGRGQDADKAIPYRVAGRHLSRFGKRLGVDPVGLGEIPRLTWIDDGHREAGGLPGTGRLAFEAAGSLHDDRIEHHARRLTDESVMAAVVVGEGFDAAGPREGGIEGLPGDLDANDDGFRGMSPFSLPCKCDLGSNNCSGSREPTRHLAGHQSFLWIRS